MKQAQLLASCQKNAGKSNSAQEGDEPLRTNSAFKKRLQ